MNLALPVLGGLGLFLYGMTMMGSGLEKAAGSRMKRIMEALTSNRLKGVLVGTLVTMIIQSSSATTVMVVGFVNAGIMNLGQAVGVIMGANIGTTITSQLIAFSLTDYAPLAVALGVAIWIVVKNTKTKTYAEILIGFGILFIGMDMMGSGLSPFAENPAFIDVLTKLNNPVMGMLAGFILTTVVQSSSASVGLLQALAGQGLVSMNLAFPILFGENIGTTTTAILSSIGTNKAAKRAAFVHFFMKVVGTLIFMTLLRYPIEALVIRMSPGNVVRQIANAHTIFNIVNTIILFPFISLIIKAAEFVIPEGEEEEATVAIHLDKRILETPSIALVQGGKEIEVMAELVFKNLEASKEVLLNEKINKVEEILAMEQRINQTQKEITDYLVLLSKTSLSVLQHEEVNTMLFMIGDIERVGDHVENITELAQEKYEKSLDFSALAAQELEEMFELVKETFTLAMEAYKLGDIKMASRVQVLEEEVDKKEMGNRKNHIERLNQGLCTTESGLIYLDVISNLERISDHSSNISLFVLDKYSKN
ncbi:MAG: Na/Pi cotransporter family protein [Tissierellia bacterium]|nr:Na/Pi cotransporter family protein [Tissierellia bacterium]